eukprot:2610373-Prorocentrum_lima.AAC.1
MEGSVSRSIHTGPCFVFATLAAASCLANPDATTLPPADGAEAPFGVIAAAAAGRQARCESRSCRA